MTSARPCIVIVGGVNGSGKSTFAKQAANTELLLGQTAINPDDLSREAEAEMPKLNIAGANLVGAERAEKAVWRAIAEGRSVAVETVLSSEKFFPVLDAARKRRYRSWSTTCSSSRTLRRFRYSSPTEPRGAESCNCGMGTFFPSSPSDLHRAYAGWMTIKRIDSSLLSSVLSSYL